MLVSLHIRNYILIDSLDINFPEGLIIITGQTGAGKSIMLGALSLLSGAKADVSMISQDADSCVIEAEFKLRSDELTELLKSEDIDSDGDDIVIRRVLNRSGRSRCFVNDCPVAISVLQDISSLLIDIHSQHKSLLLSDKQFQLAVLDHFVGNETLLQECSDAYRRQAALKSETAKLSAQLSRAQADSDYNTAQLQQLQDAALKEDELEELEAEHRTLANAEQIQSALYAVQQALNPQEQSISSNLKDAARRLDAISSYLEDSSSLSARLDSARFEIEDISEEVQAAIQRLDLSPDRLQWVEDRLSLLYSLMRKHNCANVGELIELRDRLALEVVDASSLEETIAEKQRELSAVQAELRKICAALSASRRKAAPDFASQILSSLVFLELESSRFEVRVDELAEPTEKGADRVSFLFSSSGRELSDVSKAASGGEISRIMLCLKAMMARFVGMPTLIFDEIDTGVSGSVADKMGQMICKMGEDMQVFSITHLPQVAAKGRAHYLVSKQGDATRPVTKISRIDGEDRIKEIARLLSGATITPEAISNAKSLLHEALS